MTPRQFAAKWSAATLKERSGSQEHFIDLCRMLGQPTPAEADSHGDSYCFERGAQKTGGGRGWADVWRKGYFAWEYKGKHKNMELAFAQLQRYAIALENPPLLVVSDMERIEIHTNFTNTIHEVHVINLAGIGSEHNLRLLNCLFTDPDQLKPGKTKAAITEEAAQRFAALAQILRDRGGDAHLVAHFLNRILFCFFAQDAKLLPGEVVVRVLEAGVNRPDRTNQMLSALFAAMKKGGPFGAHVIDWFNGSLFDARDSIPLEANDIRELLSVATLSWSAVEPSIFGTLFERGLDPAKRAQIGAHYTDPQSIMRIVEPVVVEPLRARWNAIKQDIRTVLTGTQEGTDKLSAARARRRAQQLFNEFLGTLAEFKVLDPACGSGNFLYMALQALKGLEHRAILEAEELGLEPPLTGMHVGVKCVHGIEMNPFAAELARVTVWIGEIQWMLRHGIPPSRDPILKPLDTIECRDAISTEAGVDPKWPAADVIVGNPPFLGNKRMLSELGEGYTQRLRRQFKTRLSGGVDLVTYWFERARGQVELGRTKRVGLVATQAIRKGANRRVLDRVSGTVPIFEAWSDEPWVNEGAAVRVSIVAFGKEATEIRLNGKRVDSIRSDLTAAIGGSCDLTRAQRLPGNRGVCFMGTSKVGAFDIPGELARAWLKQANPKGLSNADVLRPWANGQDLVGRPLDKWIIDFGAGMPVARAALYQAPFSYVEKNVKPERRRQRRDAYRQRWWIYAEARPGLRKALRVLDRFIATPRVAKHRFFVWIPACVIPDSRLFAICRQDDITFGVLSSRFHIVWATANSSRHGIGNDPTYNGRDCFETFPFPNVSSATGDRIGKAGRELCSLRDGWLNPPEWVDRVQDIRNYPPRVVPKAAHEEDLKQRTLTKLYNVRPTWLKHAEGDLDQAVAAAYGWSDYTSAMSDHEILDRLMALNLEQAGDLFSRSENKVPDGREVRKQGQRTRNKGALAANQPSRETLERRLAVVCTLVNRLADDPHFGRTKMAKLFYLVDSTQNLNLDTSYHRQAAGPLDAVALYDAEIGLEALAVKQRYLTVENSGRKITYHRGPHLGSAMDVARKVLGQSRTGINRLIDRFRQLNTDQCEIVATLYACWNDLLLAGSDANDAAIIAEFRDAWHERKRRFGRQRLVKALVWMRANGLVPTGRGLPTTRRG